MEWGSWHCTGDRDQDHPLEKKCKKAKWLSGKALQIAVKRREAKSKGEKERCKHLNAEFQRIARRDKKTFFSNQCKEIEEKNRMGKTRDLFKKIRDTQGNILCKDGQNKGEKSYGPNRSRRYYEEVARIHRRTVQIRSSWNSDNYNGIITYLEPGILECEVKWALGSITMNKASGGDEIPGKLFQIQKDDAVKVLSSICQQNWKTQKWPQDWKR